MIEKERDGAAELLKHEHCLRSVPNCDRLKRVNSSKALGAVGALKTDKNNENLRRTIVFADAITLIKRKGDLL